MEATFNQKQAVEFVARAMIRQGCDCCEMNAEAILESVPVLGRSFDKRHWSWKRFWNAVKREYMIEKEAK